MPKYMSIGINAKIKGMSIEKVDKALYLVTGSNVAIPGFDAYRYAVLRVPGLWWQVPFFYIPVFSRLIGRPMYNWIAANRGVISQCVIKPAPR